jgi:hypothetical protein
VLLAAVTKELSSDNFVIDCLSGSNATSSSSCELLCFGGPVGDRLGGLRLPGRGMACGDGEVGRGRANWVNIRPTEAVNAVCQVSMDLSW